MIPPIFASAVQRDALFRVPESSTQIPWPPNGAIRQNLLDNVDRRRSVCGSEAMFTAACYRLTPYPVRSKTGKRLLPLPHRFGIILTIVLSPVNRKGASFTRTALQVDFARARPIMKTMR